MSKLSCKYCKQEHDPKQPCSVKGPDQPGLSHEEIKEANEIIFNHLVDLVNSTITSLRQTKATDTDIVNLIISAGTHLTVMGFMVQAPGDDVIEKLKEKLHETIQGFISKEGL